MVTKDIAAFARENWSEKYSRTVEELSKDDQNRPLIQSKTQMFCFDAIIADLFPEDRKPNSADAIYLQKDGTVLLIEFKRGFKRIALLSDLKRKSKDKSLSVDGGTERADTDHVLSRQIQETKIKLLKKEVSELKSSIQMKAMESYMALEKKIFPLCKELTHGKKEKLKFLVVIDEDNAAAGEEILAKPAKRQIVKNNPFDSLRQSLRRFKNQRDAAGQSYLYDEIDVISCREFSSYLKLEANT